MNESASDLLSGAREHGAVSFHTLFIWISQAGNYVFLAFPAAENNERTSDEAGRSRAAWKSSSRPGAGFSYAGSGGGAGRQLRSDGTAYLTEGNQPQDKSGVKGKYYASISMECWMQEIMIVDSTSPDCLGYRSEDLQNRLKGRRDGPIVLQLIDPSIRQSAFNSFWQLINIRSINSRQRSDFETKSGEKERCHSTCVR